MPRILTKRAMKNVIHDSEDPGRNLHGPVPRRAARCDQQYEVIAHALGAALKRCFQCGRLG